MIYCFGSLTLDTDLYGLSMDDKQVDVEPQVFDLLVYLIRNRDRVVARNELLDHLWKGRVVTDSALSARLKAARKAIGDSGNQQTFIKTIHGRGYQFIAEVTETERSDKPSKVEGRPASLFTPDSSSIAILPFKNMSGDPEQDYFSDGITEDIITELSRFRELRVMARDSCFYYKGHTVRVQDIGRELGVAYVVEGSLRKAADRIRVTVQMVETATGNHIWAERYDRELGEIFSVQDELTRSIVTVLSRRVEHIVEERARRAPTQSLTAYDNYLRGRWMFLRSGAEDEAAGKFMERAIQLDPNFALAYAMLANFCAYRLFSLMPWGGDPEAQAKSYMEQALALEEHDCLIHVAAADVYLSCAEFDLARYHAEAAIKLNPNDIRVMNVYGFILTYSGDAEEGLKWALQAQQMEVHVPGLILEIMAETQYLLHDYEAAIETYKRWRDPPLHTYTQMAACYAQLGRTKEAELAVVEYDRRRSEGSDFLRYAAQHARICKRKEDADHWLDGYRKAGLLN